MHINGIDEDKTLALKVGFDSERSGRNLFWHKKSNLGEKKVIRELINTTVLFCFIILCLYCNNIIIIISDDSHSRITKKLPKKYAVLPKNLAEVLLYVSSKNVLYMSFCSHSDSAEC